MMFRFSISIIALASASAFTPISFDRQWKQIRSTTTLFDTEQSILWSPTTESWLSELSTKQPLEKYAAREFSPSNFIQNAMSLETTNSDKSQIANPEGDISNEYTKRKVRAKVRETGADSIWNYIKTMCNHELLNKNEEVILAREIQILVKWEEERENL